MKRLRPHRAFARTPRRVLALILAQLFLTATLRAQLDNVPPTGDTAILLRSTILNEPRSIWVHLPPDYASSDETCPVIYVLDGNSHFSYTGQLADFLSSYDVNRIPEIIVVGIVNIDRGKDLALANPPSTTQGAVKFAEYIRQEVIPYIDCHYRTAPYRILMGHSLAGQFALYVKDKYPDLFKSTILVSPAVFDPNDSLIIHFGSWLQTQHAAGKMFISLGGENPREPKKLVLVKLGNLRLKELKSYFERNAGKLIELLEDHSFIILEAEKIPVLE